MREGKEAKTKKADKARQVSLRRALTRYSFAVLLPLLGLGLFLLTVLAVGQLARDQIRDQDRYAVAFGDHVEDAAIGAVIMAVMPHPNVGRVHATARRDPGDGDVRAVAGARESYGGEFLDLIGLQGDPVRSEGKLRDRPWCHDLFTGHEYSNA